jgi:diguanylate cyclase (GGDEF)-like protein
MSIEDEEQHHFVDLPPNIEVDPRIYQDELTGLRNKAWLKDHLPEIIEQNEKFAIQRIKDLAPFHSHLGMLMLDLDNFKKINDTQGHSVGDKYLQEVAQVLHASTREQHRQQPDLIRLQGDEFIVILYGLRDEEDLQAIEERIRKYLEADDKSASIGAILYQEGETEEEFLQRADIAMYLTKKERKVSVKTPEQLEAAREIGRIANANSLNIRDIPLILKALEDQE